MFAVSTLYRRITPFVEPETVATPLANVIAVFEPKLTWAPAALLTVGLVAPAVPAPAKVRVCDPV